MKVIIITTGGTIEKTYDEEEGTLTNRGSQLQRMLKRLRLPYTQIHHIDLLWKDSLEMTDHDRQIICNTVTNFLPEKSPVLILHGTDTMEITAQYLYDRLMPIPIPLILTGAMKPFGFEDSDALQNFIEALFACRLAPPGIYISFHNMLHPMPGVRKDRLRKTFISDACR
ncbi:MAG: asparaginase [candidate division KSB1 bacterium]|nr:asparaginase [candidate division KSB1 bacterium]